MWDREVAPQKLKERFPEAILGVGEEKGEVTLVVRKEDILPVSQFLHDDPAD